MFQGGAGLSANVEYTSEELSFLQLRSGKYTRQLLENLFETEEYQNNDNFYKQALIKKSVSKARAAAYNDMIGVEFEDSLGAWENAEATTKRLNDEKLRILENKVITSNFGEPLIKTFEEYTVRRNNDNKYDDNKNSYSGDGSTSAFTYTFKITDQDDIDVIIRSADGSETTKTITLIILSVALGIAAEEVLLLLLEIFHQAARLLF